MGNELSEGCFRSKTLGKGRTPFYDMGRVTPNNIQTKIDKYGQKFSSKDQVDKKKQSASAGKMINEPIFRINKKSCEITQLNFKSKMGKPLGKNGISNNEQSSDQLKIQKKKAYFYNINNQTAPFQGNNQSSTNDSKRQSFIDSIKEKKSDSLNTSQISLSQFNLPEETIVHEKEESQQIQNIVKTNDKHKNRLNSKTNDSKSNRSYEMLDTAKYNSLQKLNGKQFLQQHKRRTKIFYEGKGHGGPEKLNEKDGNQNKRGRRQTQSINKSNSQTVDQKKKTWTHSQLTKNFNNYGL